MRIYNSLTKKLEEFVPINKDEVKIYVCGPTVYSLIHIGNARPIIIFDCFRRYLKYLGYSVKYVQNFTDIDDKIINRAKKEKLTTKELAEKYIKEYEKDVSNLNVEKPTISPKVTENINLIIKLIEKLIEKKYCYEVNGNVYFSVSSYEGYGKLSNMPLKELEKGKRVEISDLKKSALDFAVWKKAKEDEPSWQSPWGEGRPGWHIECSAMALHFLGQTIDLHCGGQDLIFPHHENEIAQSEAATGKIFSRFWMHNGHVKIDGSKMSKSSGNFLTVREIGEKYGYETLRFFILQAHYNMPINFTEESLKQSKLALKRIYNFKENLEFAIKNCKEEDEKKDEELNSSLQEKLKYYEKQFFNALDEDFNTALAISFVFELIRNFNTVLKEKRGVTRLNLSLAEKIFLKFMKILGIVEQKSYNNIPEKVLILFKNREDARKEKNFKLADELREEILKLGFQVEETRFGSKIKKIN